MVFTVFVSLFVLLRDDCAYSFLLLDDPPGAIAVVSGVESVLIDLVGQIPRLDGPDGVPLVYPTGGSGLAGLGYFFGGGEAVWELINESVVYKLYRDGIQLSVIGSNQDPIYIDQFVEQNIIYEYCVEAENDCGNSDWICDEGFLGIGELGDVNLDATIDVLDVVLLLNFILELQTPTDDQIWLSDINQDQVLNILDIVALVSIILD